MEVDKESGPKVKSICLIMLESKMFGIDPSHSN